MAITIPPYWESIGHITLSIDQAKADYFSCSDQITAMSVYAPDADGFLPKHSYDILRAYHYAGPFNAHSLLVRNGLCETIQTYWVDWTMQLVLYG